jgi:hypothetical protein
LVVRNGELGDQVEILLDQTGTVAQGKSDLRQRHAQLVATADAIEVGEVTINGLKAMLGFAGDLVRPNAAGK